jgi:hypothetical protein
LSRGPVQKPYVTQCFGSFIRSVHRHVPPVEESVQNERTADRFVTLNNKTSGVPDYSDTPPAKLSYEQPQKPAYPQLPPSSLL